MRRILIALGGNAIKQAQDAGTTQEQLRNCMRTARTVVDLMGTLDEEDRVSITHGNGPQAGNLLVQQEEGSKLVAVQDLDVIGAMTQGQIGYMLSQSIQNTLLERTDWREEIAEKGRIFGITNQTLVDANDPGFQDPTKPVGNFFSKDEVDYLVGNRGYVVDPPPGKPYVEKKMTGFVIKRVKPTGERPFRRVVPSPDPIKNIEGDALKAMVDIGYLVIGLGGGGIPVIKDENGKLKGVFAVIDKDLAGQRMAEAIGATEFYILTDIDKVKLNYGKPNEKDLDKMSVDDAKLYLEQGHFLRGSMLPKVKSCIRFLQWGGEKARIGHLAKGHEVVAGKGGTEIFR